MAEQFVLDLRSPYEDTAQSALWSPRDIWKKFSQELIPHFQEDRRIEYKLPQLHLEDLSEYFSMFSNTADGGVIVIGVDKKGNVRGCSYVEQSKINDIEKVHVQRCPLARPEYRRVRVTVDGKEDFLIAVYIPYVGRLVETNKQQAFIRYGDSNHRMSDEERRDFRSSRHELSWEQELCGLSYPDNFDTNVIVNFCENYKNSEDLHHRSNEEILEICHLGKRENGVFLPNNALAVLAALNPRKLIPGCRVRIQRFEGTKEGSGDTYRPLVDRLIEGNVVTIIERSREFIENILYDFTWLNSDGKFITTKEYPFPAWFEALVNSCVHRSYTFSGTDITVKFFEDRLEVESPGGFCPPVNGMNIYEVRASRNPILMDALYRLGYTRMAREGTRRMRDSMREWKLPEPIFEQESIHGVLVRVTLQNNKEMRKRVLDKDVVDFFGLGIWRLLEEDEKKVAAYAYRNNAVNVSEAQRVIGRTWSTSKKVLERLTKKGVLVFIQGEYERDSKAHYRLAHGAENGENQDAR